MPRRAFEHILKLSYHASEGAITQRVSRQAQAGYTVARVGRTAKRVAIYRLRDVWLDNHGHTLRDYGEREAPAPPPPGAHAPAR